MTSAKAQAAVATEIDLMFDSARTPPIEALRKADPVRLPLRRYGELKTEA